MIFQKYIHIVLLLLLLILFTKNRAYAQMCGPCEDWGGYCFITCGNPVGPPAIYSCTCPSSCTCNYDQCDPKLCGSSTCKAAERKYLCHGNEACCTGETEECRNDSTCKPVCNTITKDGENIKVIWSGYDYENYTFVFEIKNQNTGNVWQSVTPTTHVSGSYSAIFNISPYINQNIRVLAKKNSDNSVSYPSNECNYTVPPPASPQCVGTPTWNSSKLKIDASWRIADGATSYNQAQRCLTSRDCTSATSWEKIGLFNLNIVDTNVVLNADLLWNLQQKLRIYANNAGGSTVSQECLYTPLCPLPDSPDPMDVRIDTGKSFFWKPSEPNTVCTNDPSIEWFWQSKTQDNYCATNKTNLFSNYPNRNPKTTTLGSAMITSWINPDTYLDIHDKKFAVQARYHNESLLKAYDTDIETGWGPWTTIKWAHIDLQVPSVTNVRATCNWQPLALPSGKFIVNGSWDSVTADLGCGGLPDKKYKIQLFKVGQTSPIRSTEYTNASEVNFDQLDTAGKYYIDVYVRDNLGNISPYVSSAQTTCEACPIPSCTVTKTSARVFNVLWENVTGANNYNITHSTTTTNFTEIATGINPPYTYNVVGDLGSGYQYFQVQSICNSGISKSSNICGYVPMCRNKICDLNETCDGTKKCNPDTGGELTGTVTCRSDCTYCGDGKTNGNEECDDGNTTAGDGCENNCTSTPGPNCPNNACDTGETCDTRLDCRYDVFLPNERTCRTDCTFCGDGIKNGTEQCDDGNTTDGDTCQTNCTTPPTTSCPDNTCDIGETCDDTKKCDPKTGGTLAGTVSSCRVDCTYCGDGTAQYPEECDDGDTSNTNECTTTCAKTYCGDGTTQYPNGDGIGEICDDGNKIAGDGCENNCTETPLITCNDGKCDSGETCDETNNCKYGGALPVGQICRVDCTFCGDNETNGTEVCDEGALNGTLGHCDKYCNGLLPISICGDNICSGSETCDKTLQCPTGTLPIGKCRADTCTYCGDGETNGTEECDGGVDCEDNCTITAPATCGLGTLDPGEQCDDGNTTGGDGCEANCRLPSICGATCRDELGYGCNGFICDSASKECRNSLCSTSTDCQCPSAINPWWQVYSGNVFSIGKLTSRVPAGSYFTDGVLPLTYVTIKGSTEYGSGFSANTEDKSISNSLINYQGETYNYGYWHNKLADYAIKTAWSYDTSDNGIYDLGGDGTGSYNISNPVPVGNKQFVLLYNGDVVINRDITVGTLLPSGVRTGGVFIIIASGNIKIGSNVKNLQGYYIADNIYTGTGVNQLRIEGGLIAWTKVYLERETSGQASEIFIKRPDMIDTISTSSTLLPMRTFRYVWEEVAP